MLHKFLFAFALFMLAQLLSWFQTNALILEGWVQQNFIAFTIIISPIVAGSFALGSKYAYEYFDDLYAVRFLGFACGYLIFIPLAYFFFDESLLTTKNIITFLLCTSIIATQFLFK